jgi:hypothetical protein
MALLNTALCFNDVSRLAIVSNNKAGALTKIDRLRNFMLRENNALLDAEIESNITVITKFQQNLSNYSR